MTPEETGELSILRTIRQRASQLSAASLGFASSRVSLGIGDDCALLRLKPGEELAITTDLSIEGRHFRLDWHPPESVGHRTLARGLSDLASMGARPVAAFLSLGLPPALTTAPDGQESQKSWVERYLDGLLALAGESGISLAGGDLAESPMALADIVLTGAVPKGRAMLRSKAHAGERIFVTGSLGGAAAELAALSGAPKNFAASASETGMHPHLYPIPRIAQGLWLRKRRLASSAIDLSDGLSTDLNHLCVASGVSAEIDTVTIPLGMGATLEQALHGGEDYELLFTAPASAKIPRNILAVPVTCIGRIVPAKRGKSTVFLRSGDKRTPLQRQGWEHFSTAK